MDAGMVTFAAKSGGEGGDYITIDETKASAFKNLDLYCVAPIVNSGMANLPETQRSGYSYDFWAIGLNCKISDYTTVNTVFNSYHR